MGNNGPNDVRRIDVSNDRNAIEGVENAILSAVERCGYGKAARFAIKLAVEEAIANGFRHGHKNLPASLPVTVEYCVSPDEVLINVEDRGPGFEPGKVPDCTLDENLEQPSGRGIMLIRAYMAQVGFNDKGNRIQMVFKKPPDDR
jgi:serine/threonine-protein kinase RsbW